MTVITVNDLRVTLPAEYLDEAAPHDPAVPTLSALVGTAGSAGRVVVLAAGTATLRLADPPADRGGAAPTDRGRPDGRVGVTFRVDGGADIVGATVDSLGGEPGVLAHTVAQARRHGSTGQLPFAAVVARDGVVIGTGVNTALSDPDPSAHGEVVAIRDAARRTRSPNLASAVVYSSCEPCAICRTVAAAAGVREIVFAAGKESVPTAIDPTPAVTAELMAAVTALLPGIARRGRTSLSPAEQAEPFQSYLEALAR